MMIILAKILQDYFTYYILSCLYIYIIATAAVVN